MVSYDIFAKEFLSKITEYSFLSMPEKDRESLIDGYMKSALAEFRKICRVDLFTTADDEARAFNVDLPQWELDELSDIVSEGMVVRWMKSYLYRQEILENVLGTKDFSYFSPAELLRRVGDAYERAQKEYTQKMREYSYNHADLTKLHLHR